MVTMDYALDILEVSAERGTRDINLKLNCIAVMKDYDQDKREHKTLNLDFVLWEKKPNKLFIFLPFVRESIVDCTPYKCMYRPCSPCNRW